MKKVLLYSGGMDSWLINKLWRPDILLYIDMKTKYSKQEILKLPKNVIIKKFNLGEWERLDGIIPMRNLYLVALATNYGDYICLGATKGDRPSDKSFTFADMTTELFNFLLKKQNWTKGRTIKISLDYKIYTKTELLNLYIKQGGNLKIAFNSTFSCYNPKNNNECWKCKACLRKWTAFMINGFKKHLTHIDINTSLLYKIAKERPHEGKEIIKAIKLYKLNNINV